MTNEQKILELENALKKLEAELAKLQQDALKLRSEIKALKRDDMLLVDGIDMKLNQAITKLLTQMGIPTNSIGFFYLRDVTTLAVYDIENLQNMSNIYAKVAKQYHVTLQTIERNIRFAIDSAWKKSDLKENANILFEYSLSKKPTNRELIRLLSDYFRTCFY